MSTFDRLVDAGKAFACGLYRNQPGALIPNPISDVLHLVWDDLCGDDPNGLPPPPQPQFSGGQCACQVYIVEVTVDDGTVFGNSMYGPIGGNRVIYTPRGGTKYDADIEVFCRGSYDNGFSPCLPVPQWFRLTYQPFVDQFGQGVITRVVDKFGGSDLCGNPPPSYPPAAPPPSGGYTSPPVSITYNDGSDFTTIFNLKPPTGDSPPPPDICLSVVVSGVEVKLCFPFGKPPGFGGDDGDSNIEELLTNIQNDIDNIQNDVDNLQNDFDKFTDPPPPEDDPDLTETDSPDDEGGEQDDLPGLKWVLVRLTTLPVKAQFGTPSVQFAGWITFRVGADYTDRVPISFENSVFPAPLGSTGYAITFTNKAKGFSKAYTQDTTP